MTAEKRALFQKFLPDQTPQVSKFPRSGPLQKMRERVSARQWAGLCFGLLGVTLVLANKLGQGPGSALGSFAHGLLPGIPTLDKLADDVHAERLTFFREPYALRADAAFINAKGFGGNNATGVVLSPGVTERLLTQRHGEAAMRVWRERRDATLQASQAYLEAADRGHFEVRYRFGEGVLEGPELEMSHRQISIPGYARPVSLAVDNPFGKLED